MDYLKFFIVFIFITFSLNADDSLNFEDDSNFFDFESAPSCMVGGAVNVITGRYVESNADYVSASANPIVIERSYSNGFKERGFLHGYTTLNVSGRAIYRKKDGLYQTEVSENGLTAVYVGEEGLFKTGEKHYIHESQLRKGVCNTAPPKLSRKANLTRRSLEAAEDRLCVHNGFDISHFGFYASQGLFYRTEVRKFTGCKHLYGYDGTQVNSIQSVDSSGRLLSEVKILDHPISSSGTRKVELVGDDGKRVMYHLSPHHVSDHLTLFSVAQVVTNFCPPIEYEYETHKKDKPERLIKKSFPEGRYLQVDYFKNKKKRVEALKAPIGTDQTPLTQYRFEFEKRRTNVWDANGNRTWYWWNRKDRLTQIHHFNAKDKLYRKEEICWGAHGKVEDPTFLRSRHLVDSYGKVWMSKRFLNDEYGRVVEESLWGNLSGRGILRDKVHDTTGEKYAIQYEYSGTHIATETKSIGEENNIQKISFFYYPGTSLVKTKYVCDCKRVRERHYYEYAPCGVAVLEIVDDGSSKDIENLNRVTQRRMTRWKLSDRGLPVEEVRSYLDLSTGFEAQLIRIVNHLSKRGEIVQKDYYDSNDQYVFSEFWKYNDYGQVVEEVDRAGRTIYFDYDANGNCIHKIIPFQEYETLYTYDFSNRLIKEEERHDDGRVFIKSYAYDLKGNRILEVDPFGNETRFEYDEFDRVVSKTLPPITDSQGQLVHGKERYTYDILNHLTSKTDANGKITRVRTNAYGKPYRIEHPDKTREEIVYYLDGSVNYTRDSQGTKTFFTYDYKGRKLTETKKSKKNEVLCTKEWKWGAFHLLEEIDCEGVVTSYSYDSAGRLTGVVKGDAETRLLYDSLGRQIEKWEKCRSSTYRVTKLVYDLLDQVIEERVEDDEGNLYTWKQYGYDQWGNQAHVIVYNNESVSTTSTYYNSSKLPQRTVDPEGNETLYHYEYDKVNAQGQSVLSVLKIDAKGNVTTVTYDARSQIFCEEQQNTYAVAVRKSEHYYDQTGHLTLKRENVIVDGELLRVHRTAFEYDSRGREIAVVEAQGELEQKITRRTYKDFGEVDEIIKPSGVILRHQYDALGRLAKLTSTDESINYTYAYDRNDQITDVFDESTFSHTSREYDEHGHITEEKLAHGFSFSYAYDLLGRLTQVELPDHTLVEYEYDAEHLREIRYGAFIHRDHYGLSGKRSSSELISEVGEIHYAYDLCFRPTAIESSYAQSDLSYDSLGNVSQVDQADVKGKYHCDYHYDDLNQLISDDSHLYTYDSMGNRISIDGVYAEHNALNQLLSDGSHAYAYDLNGNLIAKDRQRFFYDALDRMTEMIDGDERFTYSYDPFHRRLSKTSYVFQDDSWVETSTERYVYQGDKEVGSVNAVGSFIELRVMGVGVGGDVGAAVLMQLDGKTYVPVHDYRGNVSSLVDADTREVVESYRYDGYGVETAYTGSGKLKNPWRFSSKRSDAETGFSYFGARYYDSANGRWTTPDPMWFVDGTHLYCYVRNNPTMFIDPDGLSLKEIISGVFGFIWDTGKSIVEGCLKYFEVTIDEHGNVHFDFGVSPTFDRQSHAYATTGGYGSVRVMTINGIFNSCADSCSFMKLIASMAPDCSSSGIYNATHGLWDIVEAACNLFGFTTRPVTLLHRAWDDYFANCPDDGIIIMVCHSQGAILTRNALASYDPELRERIHVVAVAPAAYIREEICGSVIHYVSKRDFVPWFDFLGRKQQWHNVEYLQPHPEAGILDHTILSPTYRDEIRTKIEDIRKKYGDLR